MKTQIVLLSMAFFAVNAPTTFEVSKLSETKSVKISKSENYDFIMFRAYHECKGVNVSWALNSTNGVFVFTLQRTYESPSNPEALWEDVESFVPDGESALRYIDNNITPGIISYRVIAWVFDGSSVVSAVSRVRVWAHR
ncbi:MAG: hypothetical protein ACHQFX_14730 [Chitinophagales bacterium]